jgi:hypothetical protein
LHPLICLAEAGVLLISSCIGKNEGYMFKGIGPKEEPIIRNKLAPQPSLLNPHYEFWQVAAGLKKLKSKDLKNNY